MTNARPYSGKLLVFEGNEGVGKTTQVARSVEYLAAHDVPVAKYSEPGGTSLGTRVRELLLHGDAPISPRAQTALFYAARAQLFDEQVIPDLHEGKVVVLDRFAQSTIAYQLFGGLQGDLALEQYFTSLHEFMVQGLEPDKILYLSASDDIRDRRLKSRGGKADNFERKEVEFFERVMRGYEHAIARVEKERPSVAVRIDAGGTQDDVFARIVPTLDEIVAHVQATR